MISSIGFGSNWVLFFDPIQVLLKRVIRYRLVLQGLSTHITSQTIHFMDFCS